MQNNNNNTVDVSAEIVNLEWQAIRDEYCLNVDDIEKTKTLEVISESKTFEAIAESKYRVDSLTGICAILESAFSLIFGVFRAGWEVTENEITELAEVWSKLIAKHTPPKYLAWCSGKSSGDGFGLEVEINAAVVTIRILKPKINKKFNVKSAEIKKDKNNSEFGNVHYQ